MAFPYPPTVAPPPPPRRRSDPKRVAYGIVAAIVVLALVGGLGWFGWNEVHDDDHAATVTTTAPPADAGLVDPYADASDRPATRIHELPAALRGVGEVGGIRATFANEAVDGATWDVSAGGIQFRGEGKSATNGGAQEFLLAPTTPVANPDLEALATVWVSSNDWEGVEHHATTVAGLPAHFATATGATEGMPVRRYVLAIDSGDTTVVATLDGTNVQATSLKREWDAFVASIQRA